MPRFDGTRADVPPMRRIMPFVMKGRNESAVYFEQNLDVSKAQAWLDDYNARGGAKATPFHLVLFGLAKMLHERPRLNRFSAGHRIYDRDGVFISFVAKKELTRDAPLVSIKRKFDPADTFEQVVNGLYSSVTDARGDSLSTSDKEVELLLKLPDPVLDRAVGLLRWLDGIGFAPPQLLREDPLYTSAFVSNLGSIKLDAAFHHLYEYGNCPLFLTVGKVQNQPVAVGKSVKVRPTIQLRWTFDERVEDGLYAGSALDIVRACVEDPAAHIEVPVNVTHPTTTSRNPMRQVDQMGAVYLAAENDRMCTHTAALTILDPADAPGGEVSLETLTRLVEQRLPLIPPFRWRLASVPLGLDHGYWYDDPDFDIDFHVRELALPAPGTEEQLKEQVARLFARSLDRARPLWEMYLIQGLEGGRVAILTKMHHAIVDGVSGAEILGTLFSLSPEVEELPVTALPTPAPKPGDWEMLARGVGGLARKPGQLLSVVRSATGLASKTLLSDGKPEVGRAPRTSLNGRISAHRKLGFGHLALQDVKTVKSALGVTVNDVVMAVASAAIRRWLIAHHELPSDPLLAVVPVSIRTEGEQGTYGNKVSAVVVPIPTHVADANVRIAEVHSAMAAAKDYHDAVPANALADATQFLPPALLTRAAQAATALTALDRFGPAMNVNISNVPGPQVPLYCAGARIESMIPLAGIADGMGLNITVISYCGRIDVGIVADREQAPDVQRIADWMAEELADLVKTVSV